MWRKTFRNLLNDALAEAQRKNPTYSLRSFARKLEVGSGPLSQYLSGKRNPRKSEALRLLSRLEPPAREIERIVALMENEPEGARDLVREAEVFLRWPTLAIRNLLLVKSEGWSAPAIAARLGLTLDETEDSLRCLVARSLVARNGAEYSHTGASITSTDEIGDEDLKRAQREQVLHSLSQQDRPLQERDITSMVFVGDAATMAAAKKEIRLFYQRLEDLMQSSQAEEVYRLSIQLCPLTRKEAQ